MEEACFKDLPEDCWALIINRLDYHHQWESLSLVSKKLMFITNHIRRSLKVINPSIEVLSKQLQRFPCLKKIDLSECGGSLQEILPLISSSGIEIEELNISGKPNPPIKLLQKISSKMKNMKVFRCSQSYLSNNDIMVLSQCFPLLEVLDISSQRIQDITDEGIIALSMEVNCLQKIDLTGNRKISDQSVISLISNCKNLTEIVLRFCYNVSHNGISYSMKNNPSLSSLILGSNIFHPLELTNSLHLSRTLSTIDLTEVTVSDDFLYQIVKADLPLKNFHLIRCKKFTLSGLYALLKAYQSLESLAFDRVDFLTDEFVIHISPFIQKLIFIKLDGCSNLTVSSFIVISGACPLLEHVGMISLSLKNSSLCCTSSVKNRSITSASLEGHTLSKVLHICPDLQVLTIHNLIDSYEVDIFMILNFCSELRQLSIFSYDKLKFSGEGKEKICKLEYLSAEKSITMNDKVLEMIGKRCPKLLFLNLNGCRSITEKGLRGIVEHCRELRYVNLDWCINVSKNFVSSMVSLCPSLRKVISMNPCDYTKDEEEAFLRQGCIVFPGSWDVDYYW